MRYNTFQYSIQIWLTTSMAVPHVYILYFFASRGEGAYLPFASYLTLLLESVLVSLPAWFIFWLALDPICKAKFTLHVKKLLAWGALELLLVSIFATLIHGFGDRATTWSSCSEFLIIGSVALALCVSLYKLEPVKGRSQSFFV